MITLPIVETFTSIQGEGYWTGTPATFIRFAGCNLECKFCDTDKEAKKYMTPDEICSYISRQGFRHVILTGGEPTLYTPALSILIKQLNTKAYRCQIETNGILPLTPYREYAWITWSPKELPETIPYYNEVKLLVGREIDFLPTIMNKIETALSKRQPHLYLQPVDPGGEESYLSRVENNVNIIKSLLYIHPNWRISLQTHKMFHWR